MAFKYQTVIDKILQTEKSILHFDVVSIYRWADQKKLRWNMGETKGTTDPVEIVTLLTMRKEGDAWRITFAAFEAIEALRAEGIDYKQPIGKGEPS